MSEEEKVKQEQSQPSGGGEPSNEDKKDDRPWKNVAKEYERKLDSQNKMNEKMAQRLANLENSVNQQVEEQSAPDADEFKSDLEEMGYEKELAEKMQNQVNKVVDYRTSQKVSEIENRIKPVETQVYKTARSANLKELEKSDDMGVVSKYRDEIEAELDKYPPNTWGNKEAVELAVSKITRKHLSDIVDDKAKKSSSPTETSHTPGSSDGTKVSKEAKARADREGISPEGAQKLIDKRNRILKEQKKKQEA